MIIKCINCNKKFNVDSDLIPKNGREIQCGSCDYKWYYKIEKPVSETLILDTKNNVVEQIIHEKNSKKDINIKNLEDKSIIDTEIDIKESVSSNFFSYLIVFIISFVALIIFVDTIKSPLIDLFPSLEIILFNFFETLKDIKLFIIDLT